MPLDRKVFSPVSPVITQSTFFGVLGIIAVRDVLTAFFANDFRSCRTILSHFALLSMEDAKAD